jgi:hypothetical protein
MKKVKFVEVGISRGEVDINKVEELEVEEGVRVLDLCGDWFLSNYDDEEEKEWFRDSFFEGSGGGLEVLEVGEEGFVVCIDEGSEWFNKFNGFKNWSEEEYNEWVKFVLEVL